MAYTETEKKNIADYYKYGESGYLGGAVVLEATTLPLTPLPQPSITDPATFRRFYMVYGADSGAPTVHHDTLESAEKEADRLARANTGKTFYVLSAIERVRIPQQPKPCGVWASAR